MVEGNPIFTDVRVHSKQAILAWWPVSSGIIYSILALRGHDVIVGSPWRQWLSSQDASEEMALSGHTSLQLLSGPTTYRPQIKYNTFYAAQLPHILPISVWSAVNSIKVVKLIDPLSRLGCVFAISMSFRCSGASSDDSNTNSRHARAMTKDVLAPPNYSRQRPTFELHWPQDHSQEEGWQTEASS